MSKNHGFTLIELVVVIVILGILAAVSVPMYLDMQTQARITAVNNLAGVVRTADSTISAAVRAKGLPYASGTTAVYPNGSASNGDTAAIRIYGGHPDSQLDGIGNALEGANIGFGYGYNNSSITATYGNFTVRWSPNNVKWEYTTAPTPANCKVNYLNGGGGTTITTVTSGC